MPLLAVSYVCTHACGYYHICRSLTLMLYLLSLFPAAFSKLKIALELSRLCPLESCM